MYELEVSEKLSKIPVFSLGDVNQIINNRNYAKEFIKRMYKKNKIFKIKKNVYSFYDDEFLISTYLNKPSYISSVSALSHYGLITQLPNKIFCATLKRSEKINNINFFHTNYFFGFKKEEYAGFNIFIAEPEKAIIDSIGLFPVSVFEESFEEINVNKVLEYLKKIKKSNIVKRVGYLLEKNGFDVYDKLKENINYKYIF